MTSSKGLDLLCTAIIALIGLLLLTAGSDYNACEFAQNNTLFFKEQTQQAIAAKNFDKAKYHAYKALNGIYKTKPNFKECGCESALKTVNNAEENLKEATRAISFEDAGVFLNIALKNIGLTLNSLESLEHQYTSNYGDHVLVMNTTEVSDPPKKAIANPDLLMQETVERSLTRFKESLEKVVVLEECKAAKSFIRSTLQKTKKALSTTTLTKAQRYYHKRVNTLAYEALSRLEDCTEE